jgi:two-component system chemotaxis response regulator CheB
MHDNPVVCDVIVIGASAGGIEAVTRLLACFSCDLKATIGIVIHRGASLGDWCSTLGRKSKMRVCQPKDGERLQQGVAYVAPGDVHMMFDRDVVRLEQGDKQHHTRPAIDPLFRSAALAFGSRVIGIALSGCGSDGALGLKAILAAGGKAFAQTPAEADFGEMPSSAIAGNATAEVMDIDQIGRAVNSLVAGVSI